MSDTAMAVLASLLASTIPLWRLGQRDPKRLRSSAESRVLPHGNRVRQSLTLLVLLPGLALMVIGQWSAFLIWCGGLPALGWLMVQWMAWRR